MCLPNRCLENGFPFIVVAIPAFRRHITIFTPYLPLCFMWDKFAVHCSSHPLESPKAYISTTIFLLWLSLYIILYTSNRICSMSYYTMLVNSLSLIPTSIFYLSMSVHNFLIPIQIFFFFCYFFHSPKYLPLPTLNFLFNSTRSVVPSPSFRCSVSYLNMRSEDLTAGCVKTGGFCDVT
jgi:hypothetical protein